MRSSLGALLLAQFLFYALGNSYVAGPAFLSDEISYLSKAATLAGYPADLANDWHGGYSLLLVPSFWLGQNPNTVWRLVLLTNALLWSASFAMLYALIKRLLPESTVGGRMMALAVTCLYPGFATTSGYAMATTGIVFFYLLASLLATQPGRAAVLGHGLAVGLLYWVHPTGLAFAVASCLALGWQAWKSQNPWPWIQSTLVTVLVLALYKVAFHPWLGRAMALGHTSAESAAVQPGPYEATNTLFQRLLSSEFWLHWPAMAAGTVSYILIASLGLVLPAAFVLLKLCRQDSLRPGALFLLLSPLGLVLLSAVFLGISSVGWPVQGPHSWYLGRYVDPALAPLLALGALTPWSRRPVLGALLWLGLSGLAIALISTPENTSPFKLTENILGLWPHLLMPRAGVIGLFGVGAAGLVLVQALGRPKGLIPVALVFLVSLIPQAISHQRGQLFYSTPTAIKTVIRTLYPAGTEVDFDPWLPERAVIYQLERRNLYTFHLFDYRMRRRPEQEWGQAPLLTYRPEKGRARGLILVAREKRSGLCLLLPPGKESAVETQNDPDVVVSLDWSPSMLAGCLTRTGQELDNEWALGVWDGQHLRTEGRSGRMFDALSFPLQEGRYNLILEGDFRELKGGVLEVVSRERKTTYLEVELTSLPQSPEGGLVAQFELSEPVQDLEVVLKVTAATDLGISKYRVELGDGD